MSILLITALTSVRASQRGFPDSAAIFSANNSLFCATFFAKCIICALRASNESLDQDGNAFLAALTAAITSDFVAEKPCQSGVLLLGFMEEKASPVPGTHLPFM